VLCFSCKIDGNPAPDPKVYLTKINSLTPGGEVPSAEKIIIDEGAMFSEHTANNVFTMPTNRSIKSALILCRGVNEFGSLSASRILYIHGKKPHSFEKSNVVKNRNSLKTFLTQMNGDTLYDNFKLIHHARTH
jgi:hypothetical protein